MQSAVRRAVTACIGAGTAVLALALGCRDARDIAAPPDLQVPTRPSAGILDAVHGSGNPHFYLLPPLVPNPSYGGTFDGNESPTVSVCAWSGSTCGAVVAQFSMISGTGAQTVRVDPTNQLYIVNWQTDQCISGPCTLDPNQVYRVTIAIGNTALGHADVYVVANQQQAKNVNTSQYIALVDGRTLPVKFRIEQGALSVIPTITSSPATVQLSSTGGEVASGDGAVTLMVPAGAVTGSTAITVSSVSTSSLDPALQSRTISSPVYQFGPDGTTFAQPLTLTLAYTPAPGVAPTSLRVFGSSNGGPWVPAGNRVVDLAAGTVSGTIRHFTNYTAMSGATTVVVSPADTFATPGASPVQLDAQLYDTTGAPITNQSPIWSSSDTSIAVVDSTGLVTPVSPGTVYITASDGASGSAQVTVLAPTVNQWTQISPWGTLSVWASSPTDVYTITGDSLFHFDGSAWSTAACAPPCGSATFRSVWGANSNEVFASYVDDFGNSGVARSETDTLWFFEPMPLSWVRAGTLWGSSSTDVYAAGDSAGLPVIIHRDSTGTWSIALDAPAPIASIWGTGPGDVYVTPQTYGAENTLHFDGSGWSSFPIPPLNGTDPSQPTLVWGAGSNIYFAEGDSIAVDSSGTSTMQCCMMLPIAPVSAMWGTSPADIFLGGNSQIAHWDGAAWTVFSLPNAGVVHQIYGTSSTNVYAATDAGVYEGTVNGVVASRLTPVAPLSASRVKRVPATRRGSMPQGSSRRH